MIQVLGSSHIFALYFGVRDNTRGKYEFKNLGDFCPGSRIVLPVEGDWEDYHLHPGLADWLNTEMKADQLVLTISGSDWLNYCISNRPEKFDFILPSHPDLDLIPDARIIPYAEIRRQMRNDIRHVLLGIKLIREAVSIPVSYIESPPPIGDNDHISRTAQFDRARIDAYGVTDPLLRRKLYLLHSELVAEACAESDVPLIRVPPHAQTPEGFLPLEGYKDDWIHANDTWGAVMLDHVHQELEARS